MPVTSLSSSRFGVDGVVELERGESAVLPGEVLELGTQIDL